MNAEFGFFWRVKSFFPWEHDRQTAIDDGNDWISLSPCHPGKILTVEHAPVSLLPHEQVDADDDGGLLEQALAMSMMDGDEVENMRVRAPQRRESLACFESFLFLVLRSYACCVSFRVSRGFLSTRPPQRWHWWACSGECAMECSVYPWRKNACASTYACCCF